MRYVSVSSGIEAASVAWEPLGWKPVFFAEIEPFPCAVLEHHWPHVPNLGDMTKIDGALWKGKADVLVGGTPCQAFSIAGARRGLEDARGNLTLTFARLANAIQPDYIVWENVPGVLSDKTNAFGCLLGMLAGEDEALVPPGGKWTNAGYVLGPERTIAWIVKDAQYFGVAQRRRRVFLVACPRNGSDPREILFEREGVRRDSAPSREAGQGVAGSAEAGVGGGGEHVAWSTKLHNTQSNQAGKWYEGYTPSLNHNSPAPAVYSFPSVGVRVHGEHSTAMTGGGSAKVANFVETARALDTTGGYATSQGGTLAFGGNNTSGFIDVATACNACPSASGRLDFETETFIVQNTFAQGGHFGGMRAAEVADPLRAKGADCGNGSEAVVAVSLRGREGGATAEVSGECCPALRASQGGGDKPRVLTTEYLHQTQEFCSYGGAQEANARKILSLLRQEIGEEAFAEWGLGILNSFLPEEVLRQAVHGLGLRISSIEEFQLVKYAQGGQGASAFWTVQYLRETRRSGRAPFGWRPYEQRTKELTAYLSQLSYPGASAEKVMRDLWEASERPGVLRQALSTLQEIRRPIFVQKKSAHARLSVRRLVPAECEFLQGFPRNHTFISWRGKPAKDCPDGPRYKALGNSMAVPCMRWIGDRIELVHRRKNPNIFSRLITAVSRITQALERRAA